MAKLEYFLVAQDVSVDQRTNCISLFHIIEEIAVPQIPVNWHQMIAVSAWNPEEGDQEKDFQAEVRVVEPDGETKEFCRNFRIEGKRCRVIMYFQGVPLKACGTLHFDLLLNGQHQASHSIDVKLAEQ